MKWFTLRWVSFREDITGLWKDWPYTLIPYLVYKDGFMQQDVFWKSFIGSMPKGLRDHLSAL